ncbi:MAG: hypothetical protein KDD41_02270 [Flavobacteriales bacterium]|nr:hypothetical protein [Flavobacteriales bacterium]
MKKTYLLLLLSSFLACSSEETRRETIDELPVDSNVAEVSQPDENGMAPEDAVQENPLTIEDFPHKWYMLNPKEENSEEYVINKWCEAETQQIQISKEGEDWFVYVLLGQDSERFKIIEFDAYEEERELYQVMYGSFVLENPYQPEADPEIYEYMWNKDLMFCHFDGFFQDGAMMVSEQNKDQYELIEEDCDYLNDM